MKQGYIKLFRQLQNCWIWDDDEPFDRRSAWIDILMSANHSDNKMLFDGSLINIGRGQFITSIRKLADRWQWSTTKVIHFLDILESDQMITRKSDSKKTLLTVVNYSIFQGNDAEEKTVKIQQNDAEVTLKKTNNNDKECTKNEKKIFIAPSVQEVADYCRERGNSIDAQYFVDYYTANGWKQGKGKAIKDWKACIRTWERNQKTDAPKEEPVDDNTQKRRDKYKELEDYYLNS